MSRGAPRCSGRELADSAWRPLLFVSALLPLLAAALPAQSASAGSSMRLPAPSLTAPDSTWLVEDSAARACLDTLSDASVRPVTVYQVAIASDTSRAVLDEIALISEHMGERVRAALGGGPDSVPSVDTLAAWRHLAGRVPVLIVVHREAATTWSIDGGSDTAKAKLAALYSAVLRTMPADELEMVWPEHLTPDSVTVYLALTPTESAKVPLPIPGYPMMSVFRTRGVAFTPAMARRHNPAPDFPMDAEQRRIGANVIEDIVVRPDGHADAMTRSVVISSGDSLSNQARDHFTGEYRSVVEQVIRKMRFEPARVAGCAVPQRADFPFSFSHG